MHRGRLKRNTNLTQNKLRLQKVCRFFVFISFCWNIFGCCFFLIRSTVINVTKAWISRKRRRKRKGPNACEFVSEKINHRVKNKSAAADSIKMQFNHSKNVILSCIPYVCTCRIGQPIELSLNHFANRRQIAIQCRILSVQMFATF